jgi:putative acetyltransferase
MSDREEYEIELRLEREEDYAEVEGLTRLAFWNQHFPGCDEHYLAHVLRQSPDFRADLDFVALVEGRIAGNIMYTRSYLEDAGGERLPILTFGPLSVHPDFQRRGLGKALIAHTFALAQAEGCPAVAIFGDPSNYVSSGFVCGADYRIGLAPGVYPAALLVRVFSPEALAGREWALHESPSYEIDREAAQRFDSGFPPMERGWKPSQEIFKILSRSFVRA